MLFCIFVLEIIGMNLAHGKNNQNTEHYSVNNVQRTSCVHLKLVVPVARVDSPAYTCCFLSSRTILRMIA